MTIPSKVWIRDLLWHIFYWIPQVGLLLFLLMLRLNMSQTTNILYLMERKLK